MSKIRVAYYIENPEVGGAQRSTGLLIRSLQRDRYEPYVICQDNPALESAVKDWEASGATVVQDKHVFALGGYKISDLIALANLFRRLKLDILHIQLLTGECRTALFAAKLAGVPATVMTMRYVPTWKLSAKREMISRIFIRMANAITANSKNTKELLHENYGWPSEKIDVIYNGIDAERFTPSDTSVGKRNMGLSPDTPTIVATGRLTEQKGFEFALRALPLVHKEYRDAVMILVGEGDLKPSLEKLAAELGVEKSVLFLGFRDDIPNTVSAADVVVVPSIFEPFGLVVAEAMAMEKPVVASQVGGIPEVLGDDEKCGLLVPPSDPASLAKGILHYLRNAEEGRAAGRAGRVRVLDRFTVERLGNDFELIYRKALPAKTKQYQ